MFFDALPTTTRFTTVGYTDASFAVGEKKVGISSYTILVNCTPLMRGSMQQTTPPDSTCSAEFVAASVCCKQLSHVENMFRFLGFLCMPQTVPALYRFPGQPFNCFLFTQDGQDTSYCHQMSSCSWYGFERRCEAYLWRYRGHGG